MLMWLMAAMGEVMAIIEHSVLNQMLPSEDVPGMAHQKVADKLVPQAISC